MLELLTSTLGTAIKSLATKAVTAPVEKLAGKVASRVDEQPLDDATRAVRSAVEKARREMRKDFWEGEDELSRDVVALLDHPPFAEEVARRLLFHGQPDFDRLRRHYLTLERDGDQEATSERWQAIEGPLKIFFETIEHHLTAGDHFGALLRDAQKLAVLARVEESQRIVAEASLDSQRWLRRSAETAERSEGELARQTAYLGQIVELLKERRDDDRMIEPTADLDPAEKSYLRLLRDNCDRLPLADDPRAVDARSEHRASLANVYVDLETATAPGEGVIFDRLGVPEEERAGLRKKLARKAVRAGGKGRLGEALEEALAAGQRLYLGGELDDEHPLRPWAADEETLKAAHGPMTALEALARHQHLVLLGDPGSGKSTFVNHLAMTLTDRLLGEEREPPATPGGPFEERLFPVRIVLRRWSARLGGGELGKGEELELFYRALDELPGGVTRERWLERFADPSTLVLFDGLDEVPTAESAEGDGEEDLDRRRLLLAAVEAFRTAHPECRVAVTCRVKPYREGGYQLAEIPTFELAPLDDPRIASFCEL